jgi:indole-3-glycerol phosphate synthase
MGILDNILAEKRSTLAELRRLELPSPPARRHLDLRRNGGGIRLITEIKRKSPSAGALSTLLTVKERASAYERGGASMISVLCERKFFDGDYTHLSEARQTTTLPLLCKDFVLDPVQLDVARSFGADAVLLIVRCLAEPELKKLIRNALERELEPFVEVASQREAQLAIDSGARLVGVNARDLDTLVMDANRALEVLHCLPPHVTRAYFSGVSSEADIVRLNGTVADAALVGECLMRADDPEPLLKRLVAASKRESTR